MFILGHKSKTICRYFAAGKCTSGSRCAFSHIIPSDSNPTSHNHNLSHGGSVAICKFFQNGHCKFGSSCTLRHISSGSGVIKSAATKASKMVGIEQEEYDEDEEHYPDMSHITSSIDQLSFNVEFPTESTTSRNRNSFLPSFLVDELLLDSSFDHHSHIHHENEHISSSSFSSIQQMSFGATSLTSNSNSPVPISPANSKPASPGFIKPPTSYGEAIKLGLQASDSPVESSNNYNDFDSYDEINFEVNEAQFHYQSRPDDLCAFSIMGKCRYGNFCRSIHGLQCPRCLLHVLHPTDMERNEEHLYECLSKPESVPIAKLHQIQCGLCNEPVLQKIDPRFGLLNCNHAFCLTCIRNWRSTHFDANNDMSRSCPHCEDVTYFIVPSGTWIDEHVEKMRVIEQYKKKMSLIPCKYFDYGRGECPFGSSCFYEHKSETCEAKAAYRHIIDHKEQIAKIRESKLSDYIVFKSATNRNKNKK